jgi:hypothetical protein
MDHKVEASHGRDKICVYQERIAEYRERRSELVQTFNSRPFLLSQVYKPNCALCLREYA